MQINNNSVSLPKLFGLILTILLIAGCGHPDARKSVKLEPAENTEKLELNKELVRACWRAEDKKVEALLTQGAEATYVEKYTGKTPLHSAVFASDSSVTKNFGKTYSIPPNKEMSERKFRIAKLLIENGADVNKPDRTGVTPLHNVQIAEIARLLLEKGANVHATTVNGITPLMSSSNAPASVGKLIINAGANVQASVKGESPLMLAVGEQNLGLVEALLVAGADANFENKSGWTALHYVLLDMRHNPNIDKRPIDKVAQILVKYGAKIGDETVTAALFGNVRLVKFFHINGANIDQRDKKDTTPLMSAISGEQSEARYRPKSTKHYLETIDYLIAHGADVNQRHVRDNTPLVFYVDNGEILKALLKAGADISAKDSNGYGYEYYFEKRPDLLSVIENHKKYLASAKLPHSLPPGRAAGKAVSRLTGEELQLMKHRFEIEQEEERKREEAGYNDEKCKQAQARLRVLHQSQLPVSLAMSTVYADEKGVEEAEAEIAVSCR